MRLALATLITLFTLTAFAGTPKWEYRVVVITGTLADGTKARVTPDASGAFVDENRSEILNKLAAQGWEVVSVAGASGSDHAVYLRRPASSRSQ
jgi:hypothetical protein